MLLPESSQVTLFQPYQLVLPVGFSPLGLSVRAAEIALWGDVFVNLRLHGVFSPGLNSGPVDSEK